MACAIVFSIPFISVFIAFALVCGAETADHLVILRPPENLTTYSRGSTFIVLGWDPPQVYTVYDVSDATYDVNVTIHNVSLVAFNVTKNIGNSSDKESLPSTGASSESTFPSNTSWECKPWSYFENYAVEMKQDPDVSDSSMVVTLNSSDLHNLKQTISLSYKNSKAVAFELGCIKHFIVSWEDVTGQDKDIIHVVPTVRLLNITDLKPQVNYTFVVKAVFVSGDELESEPIHNSTIKADEPEECSCDWHGSLNIRECSPTNGLSFCKCKPGYEGILCEKCSDGYYRAAPFFPCHRCPCDTDFAHPATCRFVEGFLHCDECAQGYTGNICHKCVQGYYKINRHCVPCFCNGNTRPGAEMCKPITGECISCQHNTTGFHCERCLPGYTGDAINHKNCNKQFLKNDGTPSDSGYLSPAIVGVLVVLSVLAVTLSIGFCMLRRCHRLGKTKSFWTVQMKPNDDDIGFQSVHNNDVHIDEDDMNFYARHVQHSSSGKYARLHEDI